MKTLPAFLITIDTEGDNAWSRPHSIETKNAQALPRFQALCERYGFAPTYLTNHEMAIEPEFVSMARSALASGTAEVGMHLHAWDTPPISPLTNSDQQYHPYLIDFPVDLMAAKIDYMTELLQNTFGVQMRSHRAGRWAFNATYAQLLSERGYVVDCSVTPGHSWAHVSGGPGRYGTDYTDFPDLPYFVDLQDIRLSGESKLLEVPMTIRRSSIHRRMPEVYSTPLIAPFMRRLAPALSWLRPTGKNLKSMLDLVDWAERSRRPYIEFMIHSSEFLPGGSPYFADASSVEKLYADLSVLFERIACSFAGRTLSAFYDDWVVGSSREPLTTFG